MIELFSILSTAIDLSIKAYSHKDKFKNLLCSPYLCSDFAKLRLYYSDSKLIDKEIPYEELYDFTKNSDKRIVFKICKKEFQLTDDKNPCIKQFQTDALAEFEKNGKKTFDGSAVRIDQFIDKGDVIEIRVSKSKYSDQVQSHLVLDWKKNKHLKKIDQISYRGYLLAKYGKKLPPLNTTLLSNSIGISVILYFIQDNCFIPYLPLRNKAILYKKKNEPALNEGIYVSSSSGVLEWGNGDISLDYIREEMFREIWEEIGLEKSEIVCLEPVSLVRELVRAGKPQFFFVGITNLNEEELVKKRKIAIMRNRKDKEAKVEIKDKHLSYLELKSNIIGQTLSLEAIGNLYYSEKYIRKLKNFQIK